MIKLDTLARIFGSPTRLGVTVNIAATAGAWLAGRTFVPMINDAEPSKMIIELAVGAFVTILAGVTILELAIFIAESWRYRHNTITSAGWKPYRPTTPTGTVKAVARIPHTRKEIVNR